MQIIPPWRLPMDPQFISDESTEEIFHIVRSRNIRSSELVSKFSHIDLTSVRSPNGQTLLHVAAGFGRVYLTSYLISQGANVNIQDEEGQGPLHNACCHGHYITSMKLIEAGADVNMTDKQGWSPMYFALARISNSEKISPLYWKVVELLLKSGADPYRSTLNGRDCMSRIKSAEDRREVRIIHLLRKLDDTQEPIERERIINSHLLIEDFFELIKIGDDSIDILEKVTTAHFIHSRFNESDGITPLHRAAGHNHIETARLLVDRGASVDMTDDNGRIPLHNAARYGHVEMIEFLIDKRSDINTQDCHGLTPLHIAASNRTHFACLKLIELGASINARCKLGKLPYDLAESHDVQLLLKPDRMCISGVIPSSSDQAIYIDFEEARESQPAFDYQVLHADSLMMDSSSDRRLFENTNYSIKKVRLNPNDWRYQLVNNRMINTIVSHPSDTGGKFSSYEIVNIELILNEKVWSKYRLMCRMIEIDCGVGSKNEKLLFHGSNFIDSIQMLGFDESYANKGNMFGAGIYFAEHSSKSNQYAFGCGQGCQDHMDKSCYICERKLIYAQVALGKSLIGREAMPDCPHGPPGFHSVTGKPNITDNLTYPEYVIYNGNQAYPLFVITYKIKP